MRVEHVLGKCRKPAPSYISSAADGDRPAVLLDQPDRPIPVFRRKRMVQRFGCQSLALEPAAGAAMQYCHLRQGGTISEAVSQRLDKQWVVAIPALLVVQRHNKQVAALDLGQEELAIGGLEVCGFRV